MNSVDIHKNPKAGAAEKAPEATSVTEELKEIASQDKPAAEEETVVLYEHPTFSKEVSEEAEEPEEKLSLEQQKQQIVEAINKVIDQLNEVRSIIPAVSKIADNYYHELTAIVDHFSDNALVQSARQQTYEFMNEFSQKHEELRRLLSEAINAYGATITRVFYGFEAFESIENKDEEIEVAQEIVRRQNDSSKQGLLEANKIPVVLGQIANAIDNTSQVVANRSHSLSVQEQDKIIPSILAETRQTQADLEKYARKIRELLIEVNQLASDSTVQTRDNFRNYFETNIGVR